MTERRGGPGHERSWVHFSPPQKEGTQLKLDLPKALAHVTKSSSCVGHDLTSISSSISLGFPQLWACGSRPAFLRQSSSKTSSLVPPLHLLFHWHELGHPFPVIQPLLPQECHHCVAACVLRQRTGQGEWNYPRTKQAPSAARSRGSRGSPELFKGKVP